MHMMKNRALQEMKIGYFRDTFEVQVLPQQKKVLEAVFLIYN